MNNQNTTQSEAKWWLNLKENIQKVFRDEPILCTLTVLLLVMILPNVAAMSFDTRTLHDVNIWEKPLKFNLSFAIYFATLAFFARWVPLSVRRTFSYKIYIFVVFASVVYEVAWNTGAAANGLATHFDNSTATLMALNAVAGLCAIILTSISLVYGVLIAKNNEINLSPSMHFAIWSGLVVACIMTCVTAGYMIYNSSHFVGGNLSDLEAWPIFGWATDGGDLRVAHLFATHTMHAIPIFAFLKAQTRWADNKILVIAGLFAYIAFTIYTLFEAINGVPFLGFLFGFQ